MLRDTLPRSSDRARHVLAAVLLLIVLITGAIDVVSGEWGRVAGRALLAAVVIVVVLTLARLPSHPDA